MHRAGTQWGCQAAQGRARMGTPPSPQGPYVPGSPRRGWEWEATGLQHSCQPPLWDTRAHKDPLGSTYRWRVVGFSGSFGAQTQTPGLGGPTGGSIPGSSASLLASGKSTSLCLFPHLWVASSLSPCHGVCGVSRGRGKHRAHHAAKD